MIKKNVSLCCVLYFSTWLSTGHLGATEQPIDPILAQSRIIEKKVALSASLRQRVPLNKVWTIAKMSMVAMGVVSLVTTVSAEWGYPLTKGYIPFYPGGLKERAGFMVVSAIGSLGLKYAYDSLDMWYGKSVSISWFVTYHAPFYEVIHGIREEWRDPIFGEARQDVAYSLEMLKLLVDRTEKLLSYMLYKQERMNRNQAVHACNIRENLTTKLEPLYQQCSDQIKNRSQDVVATLDVIATYLSQGCLKFALLENTKWIDPATIYEIVQTARG